MSPQGAWISFVSCILIASFTGGALRLLFSPEQVRQTVNEFIETENPPLDISFESIKMSLSDGFWPRLGIEVKGLQVSSQSSCTPGAQLYIKQAYLPISFSSLLGQKLQFGQISAQGGYLNKTSHMISCQEFERAETRSSHQNSSPPQERRRKKTIKKIQKFMKQRWPFGDLPNPPVDRRALTSRILLSPMRKSL